MAVDILLLEDDEEIIAAVSQGLEEEGFAIRVARSGVAAFIAVMEALPDVVIADLDVHGDDTRKFYQVMRQLTAARAVPFLFLGSIVDSSRMKEDDLGISADGFLSKPFPASQLREELNRLKKVIGESDHEIPEGPSGTCNVKEVLIDTLEFLVAARRNATLTVAAGGEEGLLSVEKGDLRHASFGGLNGEEALLRILRLEDVAVSFREGGEDPMPNLHVDWRIFVSTHC